MKVGPDTEDKRAGASKITQRLTQGDRIAHLAFARRGPPLRFLHSKEEQQGQQNTRRASYDKGHAPSIFLAHPAKNREGDEDADGGGHRKEAKRQRPLCRSEEVRDNRIGRSNAACLPRPQQEAGDGELHDVADEPVHRRHQAPESEPNADNIAPAPAIRQRGDWQSCKRIEQGESKA